MQSVVDVSGGLVLIYRGAEAQRITDVIRGRFGIPLSRVSALAVLVHAPLALAMFDASGCLAASNLVRPEVFFEALAPPS